MGTTNPYSEKSFEPSPLNRIVEQAAPGSDWSLANNHTIRYDYQSNMATEVRRYAVSLIESTVGTGTTFTPTLVLNTSIDNGYYNANELHKTITKDENWVSGNDHTVQEFKNKRGQVVLRRTYNGMAHDTYYVYDVYGNLSYVLSPKAKPHVAKPDANELAELCYQYKYDKRNRLIEKKIPGKGWEYVVYDKLDRPILTQDAKMRLDNKWLFTKYDIFGRVTYTGMMNSGSSRESLQNVANSVATVHVAKLASATTLAGTTMYYSNDGYPTTNIAEIHTINYYDNYAFDRAGGNTETTYGTTPIVNAIGLPTGSKVRVLDSSPVKWITTVSYYDEKARPIYTYKHNDYLQTTEKTKSKLDFVGKALEVTTMHSKTGQPTITTIDRFDYDDAGRLLSQKQQIDNLPEEVIFQNNYDDLGQLVGKGVGGKTTQERLQNIDYGYNVRGWLKTINNPTSLGDDLFGFKLSYNAPNHGATPLFNGNIVETEWKTDNEDNSLKWYAYSYDALNRIVSGTDNTNRYSLSGLVYDENGNILNLTRKGHVVDNPEATNGSHFWDNGHLDLYLSEQ